MTTHKHFTDPAIAHSLTDATVSDPTSQPKGELPRLVSLGGGHGLFVTLRGGRTVADYATAIVTVADDGGSSGRMRSEFDCLPPGDLRMALAALTADTPTGRVWEQALQHRFPGRGGLNGHAVGNFMITGLAQVLGDDVAALDHLARLLGIRGRVLPMSTVPLDLEADVLGLADDPREVVPVRGQVAVATTIGQVRRVRLIPHDPPATRDAVEAIAAADMITLGPGSWFSSVIPHVLVPGIVDAMNQSAAPKVLIMNLVAEAGETSGMSLENHLHMLWQHAQDLRIDLVLMDDSVRPSGKALQHMQRAAEALGARIIYRDVREDDGRGRWTNRHKPRKLAQVLAEINAHREQLSALPETLPPTAAETGGR